MFPTFDVKFYICPDCNQPHVYDVDPKMVSIGEVLRTKRAFRITQAMTAVSNPSTAASIAGLISLGLSEAKRFFGIDESDRGSASQDFGGGLRDETLRGLENIDLGIPGITMLGSADMPDELKAILRDLLTSKPDMTPGSAAADTQSEGEAAPATPAPEPAPATVSVPGD